MSLSERDRKALTWGGTGVAAILLFGYVISPVWQRWTETRDLLESREAFVVSFRERMESREAALTRRDSLAMRLGSLRVLHAKAPEKKPEGAPPGEGAPKPGEAPPGGPPQPGDGPPKEGDGKPKPDPASATPGDAEKAPDAGKEGAAPKDDGAAGPGKGAENPAEASKQPADGPRDATAGGELVVAKNVPAETGAESPASPPGGGQDNAVKEKKGENDAGEETAEKKPEEGAPEGPKPDQTADAKPGPGAKPDPAAKAGPGDGGNGAPGKEGAPADAAKAEGAKPEGAKAEGAKPGTPERSPVPVIEASSLATYIEKNAQTAQIKIKRITPKKSTSGKKRTKYFEPVTLQVNFECQATNLVKLLHDLEKGELFVRVDQMEITRDMQKGDLLNASMDISSYEIRRDAT